MADREKERITYYDMDGREAQMYGEIDSFLGLSRRYSPEAVRNKRIFGTASFSIGAAVSLLLIIALKEIGFSIFGISAVIGAVYFGRYYGRTPFEDVVRTEIIIDRDGLERVYDDLKHASRIAETSAYIGNEYIFINGKVMCRICDISDIYIREESDDDSTSFYASIKVRDDAGCTTLDLDSLTGFRSKTRYTQFEQIKQPIEAKRRRLLKLEDRVEI